MNMKKILTLIFAASLFLIPAAASAACSPIALGGTGACTFTAGVIYSPGGTAAFQSTPTTTASCSGSASCTPFVIFGSSPITISASGSGTPGGLNTQLQYNNSGSFGGITGAVTDGTAVSLTGAHLLNPTINGAGTGLATLAYPNTSSNATITFPIVTGTLATLAGTEALTNKSVNGVTLTTGGSATTFLNGAGAYTTPSGGGGTGNVATSTGETAGQLAYWTSTNGTPALLGKVATTTATCAGTVSCTTFTVIGSSPITLTGAAATTYTAFTPLSINGANVISIATSSSSVSGFLQASDFSKFNSATTTFSSPLVYTLGTNAVTCPTCNTSSASVTSVNNGSTGSTLTFTGGPITTSGTINGEINLAHANTWLAIQLFSYTGSTTFSGGIESGTKIAAPYFIATSSTATSTFAGGIKSPCFSVDGINCLTQGGSGTVTSVAQTVPGFLSISGSPITTSGTLAISYSGTALPAANGGTATTTSGTTNAVWYNDGTNVFTNSSAFTYINSTHTLTLNGGGAGDAQTTYGAISFQWALGYKSSDNSFRISSSTALGTSDGLIIDKNLKTTLVNASTTALSASGALYTPVTSALLLADANKLTTAYAGSSCTNQFVRSINGAGVATCATVSAGDVSLANLTATDATLTFSGTYNGSTARTIGINLANPNTWTGLQTINSASSTNLTVSNFLTVPFSTNPILAQSGSLAINTTAASSSVAYYDGTAQRKLFDVTDMSFTFINYPTNGTGTTTVIKAGGARGYTLANGSCFAQGGTANVQAGTGSASSTMLITATSPTGQISTTLSSNNTYQSLQPMYVAIGTFSSSGTTTVTCSYGRRYDY